MVIKNTIARYATAVLILCGAVFGLFMTLGLAGWGIAQIAHHVFGARQEIIVFSVKNFAYFIPIGSFTIAILVVVGLIFALVVLIADSFKPQKENRN